MLNLLKRRKRFYSIAATVLMLSYLFNIFGLGLDANWFGNFDIYSENFALQSLQCANNHNYHGGLIFPDQYIATDSSYPANDTRPCAAYQSQFGLQGYVYAGVSHVAHGAMAQLTLLSIIKFVLVALMVTMLLLFVLFVEREFGKGPALFTTAMLVLSDWPAAFARNLYWVSWLFFLPFIMSLYAYPRLRRTPRGLAAYLGLLGITLLIKFLTGFEFFSVITVSAAVPIVYWELKFGAWNRETIQKIITRGAMVAATGVAMFILAFGLTVISLKDDYGSTRQAVAAIKERGELRTNAHHSYAAAAQNFQSTRPQLFWLIGQYRPLSQYEQGQGNPLVFAAIVTTNYLSMQAITLPVTLLGFLPMILQSFLLWFVLAALAAKRILQRKLVASSQATALIWSLVVSALGFLTWPVVATGHFYEHAHIDPIIFYMPFMLWGYCAVGILLTPPARRIANLYTAKIRK